MTLVCQARENCVSHPPRGVDEQNEGKALDGRGGIVPALSASLAARMASGAGKRQGWVQKDAVWDLTWQVAGN
jgi:hypothetical protein